MMHHYAVYEADTGKVISVGRSTNPAAIELTRDRMTAGQALYEGEINPGAVYLPGGVPTRKPDATVVVTPQEVKAHAGRILSYTDWVEIRAINGSPVSREMAAYRQGVRDRSGEIEAMSPIPADFRDANYWPVIPNA